MSTFGISIFPSPEHFVAFYISMLTLKKQSAGYLQLMMKRNKNPPISVIYTAKFLCNKSAEEYGLDIIRFISQLSDLSTSDSNNASNSQGSMLKSLKNVIDQSSFLIEVRHNLTHKNMIEREVIDISRQIILKNLQQKYWKQLFDKIINFYYLKIKDIQAAYEQIYCRDLEGSQGQFILKILQERKNEINEEWLASKCNNYQFKQFFPSFYNNFPKSKIISALSEISRHKWAIALNYLLQLFTVQRRNQELLDLIAHLLRSKSDYIMQQELVLKKLRQISFTHYLGLSKRLLISLPENVQDYLQNYWLRKSEKTQIYCRYSKKQPNKKQTET